MTVFGLHLGEKFALPECERDESAEWLHLPPSYITSTEVLCFMWEEFRVPPETKPNTAVINHTVTVLFPDQARPPHAKGFLWADVIDGNLEGVVIFTAGLESQDYWLAQLDEKYGEPASIRGVQEENTFGAVFTDVEAEWHFANLVVQLGGADTKEGIIHIFTNKGRPVPKPPAGPKL
jgi:hypothetical protein